MKSCFWVESRIASASRRGKQRGISPLPDPGEEAFFIPSTKNEIEPEFDIICWISSRTYSSPLCFLLLGNETWASQIKGSLKFPSLSHSSGWRSRNLRLFSSSRSSLTLSRRERSIIWLSSSSYSRRLLLFWSMSKFPTSSLSRQGRPNDLLRPRSRLDCWPFFFFPFSVSFLFLLFFLPPVNYWASTTEAS